MKYLIMQLALASSYARYYVSTCSVRPLNQLRYLQHCFSTSLTRLNNSVRTAKKTQHFTVTKINRLTLFKEIIAVYSENRTEHTNILRWHDVKLLAIKSGCTQSYH
jgi:hypothetical protein